MPHNKGKNESAASNYVFQCSQWKNVIMPLFKELLLYFNNRKAK